MILMGDFNVFSDNPCIVELDKEMTSARTSAIDSDTKGSYNGWGTAERVIDYIYYSGFSQCPIFKELSAKATENHRTIVAQKMSDEISIEGYVSTYENKTKIRLSIEESIKRLNNINEWQDTLLKQWAEFKQLKQQAIDLHAQIMATKSTVIKEYVALYNQVIKSKIAVESGIAAFKKLIKTQNEVIDYIALVAKISANHETLTNALKGSKVASKVYQSYFKTIDLTWHEGGNMFDVANKVLSNQAELLKHHKQLSHEQENRLKKMKYDSIEEFIKIYKRL
jgi:hypothetical protein